MRMSMAGQSATGWAVVGNRLIVIGTNDVHVEAQQGSTAVDSHRASWYPMRAVANGA